MGVKTYAVLLAAVGMGRRGTSEPKPASTNSVATPTRQPLDVPLHPGAGRWYREHTA